MSVGDRIFAEYCEKLVMNGGGKIVREGFAHGEINGFILPARTMKAIFWKEQLFTPYGLATLFNLVGRSNRGHKPTAGDRTK